MPSSAPPLAVNKEVVPSSSPPLAVETEAVPSPALSFAVTGTSPSVDPHPSIDKGKDVLHSDSVPPPSPSKTTTAASRPGGLRRGQAWDGSVSEEIGTAFFPPRRFLGPQPLSDEDVHEVQDVFSRLCKALGLSQAYLHLHGYYVRATGESRALKLSLETSEEKAKRLAVEKEKAEVERDSLKMELKSSQDATDKASEDLLLTHQALTQANVDLMQANANLAEANSNLAEANSNLAEMKSSHSQSMNAVKRLTQQRSELCAELEGTRGALEKEKAAHQKAADAVRKAASNCFEMDLAQIEYLNPGLKLNLAGYGCRSFFKGGVLVPPPPSPEDESVSNAEDDGGEHVGEEVASGAEPNGGGAPVDEVAP
ncbi:hypothetical protein K1719_032039 [Acacia pycnantha]|nr:hypothetical protein K1719_032039 [Acacia pycnantha]